MHDAPEPIRSRSVTIINPKGLHARAAAKFAKLCGAFMSEIIVTKNGTSVSGRSIMGLMMLAAARGSEIEIAACGSDAEPALSALVELVRNGFGEL